MIKLLFEKVMINIEKMKSFEVLVLLMLNKALLAIAEL